MSARLAASLFLAASFGLSACGPRYVLDAAMPAPDGGAPTETYYAPFIPPDAVTEGLRDLLEKHRQQMDPVPAGLSPIVVHFADAKAASIGTKIIAGDVELRAETRAGGVVYLWPQTPWSPGTHYALVDFGLGFTAGNATKELLDAAAAVPAGTLALTKYASGTESYSRLMGSADVAGVAFAAEGTMEIEDRRGARKRGWGEDTPVRTTIRVLAAYPAAESDKIVILQHGAGNSARFVLDNASDFCAAGLPVIGIDIPSQGARSKGEGALWDIEDLPSTRDHIREGAYDLVQLHKALRAQGNRVRLLGRSLGGMVATLFLAAAPDVEAAVLNQTGGGFGEILIDAPFVKDFVGILFQGFTGLDPYAPPGDEAWKFMQATGQMGMNAGDALVYAPLVTTPRVLVQTSPGDLLVPNASTERLAAAIASARLTSWPMPPERSELNPHLAFEVVPGMRAEAAAFLAADE